MNQETMIYLIVFNVLVTLTLTALTIYHSIKSYRATRYEKVLHHDARALLCGFLAGLTGLIAATLRTNYT